MFDLNKIELIQGEDRERNKLKRNYSFVGIKQNGQTGQMEFWLPLGFADFPKDFEAVKQFFFRMYRTLRKYLSEKEVDVDLLDNKRDGIYKNEGGFRFKNEFTDNIVLYSKLNAFDKILDGFDELRIASLESKAKRTLVVDYSQIHKYLHKAIYLDEDIIYIDEMDVPKGVIIPESTSIIKIFCYIYNEIKIALEESNEVPVLAKDLAEEFREKHLPYVGGLFAERGFEETLSILRLQLDETDRLTTYKDDDYWHFFEAVESFLYASNEFNTTDHIYWGINNFSFIWERMCQEYAFNNFTPYIQFAERKNRLVQFNFNLPVNPYELKLRLKQNSPRSRFLKPDLVAIFPPSIDWDGFMAEVLAISESKGFDFYRGVSFSYYGVQIRRIINSKIYNKINALIETYSLKNNRYAETLDIKYRKIPSRFYTAFLIDFKKLFPDESYHFLLRTIPSVLSVSIIDFKYMATNDYQEFDPDFLDFNGENKILDDIKKQLVYEYTWQKNYPDDFTVSEFWLPGYFIDSDFKKKTDVSNDKFNINKIKVYRVNFNLVQKAYLGIND